jgi:cellulose synthase/poly-beta-1,6-N-acetylglucosamine synthase-like glycosyltransferase
MVINWWQAAFYMFCLTAAIQLFYYFFFFIRLAFYKSKPVSTSQPQPVSVIICARDEAANLAKNLPGSLVQQYATTHEVIVVNDNSYDESKYILEEYHRQYKQLHIVELTQEARFIPGKKYPLSIGIKTAKHEVVLLTDADCVPASEFWIYKMQAGFTNNKEIVLGYGAYHKKKGLLNKLIRWETFHTALQCLSFAQAGFAYMGVGRNLSYKKSLFFRNKGFSAFNHISSGDDDLFINQVANQKNTGIVIDHNAFTLSEPPITWAGWKKQKRRHYSTGKYYRTSTKFLLGLYSGSHILFYPLFITSLFYSWKLALPVFAARLILQSIILYNAMKKLNEKDLYPYFVLLDLWTVLYYLYFSFAIFRKPPASWK